LKEKDSIHAEDEEQSGSGKKISEDGQGKNPLR